MRPSSRRPAPGPGLAPGLALLLALTACAPQEPPPRAAAPPVAASTPAAAPVPPPLPAVDTPPPLPAASAAVPAPAAPPDGAAIFAETCATCHMADGSGVPYLQPPIKGSAWISNPDPQLLLSLILRGSAVLGAAAEAYENDMAPQEHLSDAQIAAVATYVRTRFAATPLEKPVTPAEVATARARRGLPE